ncbi:MAG: hypothetical protein KKH41_07550 [Candidatus Thermoplasmatota archaeon]|nr:hypothetical protein [Candidatus Thermoplasmatota archaeon]MBU4143740.1 hypothetical protein [Candidatus Thermoplasmatota archaeon]MBU4592423.1 hypothetical protein [Candidatus Thermoplasmatota archaeon]
MIVLEDDFNLRLLRHPASGNAVRVNINSLAKDLGMHRTATGQFILKIPGLPYPN